MQTIDLTGGEVKVLGNRGDEHLFRLSNPETEEVIATGGEYSAEFISSLGNALEDPIELDVSEIDTGILTFSLIVLSGTYIIRRTNPQRTILTIEVEVA